MTALAANAACYGVILYFSASRLTWLGYRPAARNARTVLRLLPYVMLAPFLGIAFWPTRPALLAVATVLGALILLARLRDTTLALHRDAVAVLTRPYNSMAHKRRAVLLIALAAPCQEIYFRGTLFASISSRVAVGVAVVVSALLFVGEHVAQNALEKRWIMRDFVTHGCLGCIAGGLVALGGGALSAILAHMIVNGPKTLLASRTGVRDELSRMG